LAATSAVCRLYRDDRRIGLFNGAVAATAIESFCVGSVGRAQPLQPPVSFGSAGMASLGERGVVRWVCLTGPKFGCRTGCADANQTPRPRAPAPRAVVLKFRCVRSAFFEHLIIALLAD
jgi:hypothetical protein